MHQALRRPLTGGPAAALPAAFLPAACLLAALLLAPAATAQVLDIPASARVDLTGDGQPELPPFAPGEGACGLFVKFLVNSVTSITAAEDAFADPDDVRRWDPDLAFRAIVPVVSLWDGAAGQGFRMRARQLMPWSVVNQERFGGGACINGPEEAITGNDHGFRIQALLMVQEAGVHTFVAQGDDGFRLRIADEVVAERPGAGISQAFSRRVRFEAPGLYPLQIDYFELRGEAYLAIHHVPEELLFRQAQNAPGEIRLVADPQGTDADAWFINVAYEDVVPLLSANTLLLPRHLDDDTASCVDQLDAPAAICIPDDDIAPELRCGNGNPDDLPAGLENPCDDGNNLDGDGCSAECETEPGWICRGTPSTCLEDTDGDGIPDVEDNCPDTPNPDQTDTRANGIGDACDLFLLLPMDGDHLDTPTLTIEGTVLPDTSVTLTLDDRDPVTVTATADGTFTWTVDDLEHGPGTLTATATVHGIDTGDTLSFTAWLDPPTVSIDTPDANTEHPHDQPLTVTGTAPPGLPVDVGLDDDILASTEADGDGTFSATLPLDGDRVGPTTLFATTSDPVGNTTRDERP
ncbi:MAG: hypothetical protein EA398_18270, partial [Deltaproteobacteria bacterium]